MYKVLPLPTVFEAGTGIPGDATAVTEQPVCHLDTHNGYVIFGDLGYSKARTIIYAQQLVDFLEAAKLVHSSRIPMRLSVDHVDTEFSIYTRSRFMMIAGVKCDSQYATTRWLDNVQWAFNIPAKSARRQQE